ncbi:MAG TPA: cyclic nucleotide-binding domain-containing protein [Candidatus Limnocylindrales bacterium]
MANGNVSIQILKGLEPLSALSTQRLTELGELCVVERVSKTLDPFRVKGVAGQLVFLLKGELALILGNSSSEVVVGGTSEARHPLGRKTPFASAKAITDIELVRIDEDLLDIMVTWDQLAAADKTGARAAEPGVKSMSNWAILSGVFSINNLKSGAFAQLPTAHINEMLKRFQRVGVKRGQVVIREGDAGDYYYVVESGKCLVERNVGGVSMKLAELKGGDAFGEEALVANAKRNATVTMLAEGSLFRLAKEDFNELLKKPLLQSVTMEQARAKVGGGGQWIDTRYPSEYQYDKLPGAINIPLSEVRNAVKVLDRTREYILYCQSGRRSSAAAFLLAQRGFRAFVLEGGLRGGAAGAD